MLANGEPNSGEVKANARDVHVGAGASARNKGLHLQEALRHDEVNCTGIDKVAAQMCYNLAEGFYERPDGDSSHCRGCSWETE